MYCKCRPPGKSAEWHIGYSASVYTMAHVTQPAVVTIMALTKNIKKIKKEIRGK